MLLGQPALGNVSGASSGMLRSRRHQYRWLCIQNRPEGRPGASTTRACLPTASCALLARLPDFVRIGVVGGKQVLGASWPRGRPRLVIILIALVSGVKVLFIHVIEVKIVFDGIVGSAQAGIMPCRIDDAIDRRARL